MSTTNSTEFQGLCPKPFLQEQKFPGTGGFIEGRFCQPYSAAGSNVTCCLPCPTTDWVYPDGFTSQTHVANWVSVAALVANVFLLVSFVLLPVKYTHRHYLSICLVLAVTCIQLAFIIPLGSQPQQCFNAITPNDMRSSLSCAFSGAFLLFGGWSAVMWVFYRALSLHLQICWEVIPGKRFFYSAQVIGWGIPAVALALALSLTGVSYRFGTTCHINHDKGLQDFWGPLLAFAAAALIIQVVTLVYCIQVYVRSLFDDSATTETSSHLPSYQGSTRAANARQAYRRVRRVIMLQWRGIAIVLVIIAFVVFFSIVFVSMDSDLSSATKNNGAKLEPWLVCLVFSNSNSSASEAKNTCLDKVSDIVTSPATILAVLICLSITGFFDLLFLGRSTMIQGWREFFRKTFGRGNEFVSADARRLSTDHRAYEMLSGDQAGILKAPEAAVMNPKETFPETSEYGRPNSAEYNERMNPLAQNSPTDYYDRDAKTYTSPATSFASPRPPSSAAGQNRGWDPQSTYARGHRFY